jgi:hypothetical protein
VNYKPRKNIKRSFILIIADSIFDFMYKQDIKNYHFPMDDYFTEITKPVYFSHPKSGEFLRHLFGVISTYDINTEIVFCFSIIDINKDICIKKKRSECYNSPSCLTKIPYRNFCYSCEKIFTKLKTCSICKQASYCTKECQAKHWKEHKKICKSPK